MTIKLPSLLSFERKLEPSDALMYAGNWIDIPVYTDVVNITEPKADDNDKVKKWQPIKIKPRFNRSTQSAYAIKDKDIEKTQPNPVSSGDDDAFLPPDKDTLKVSFTLRIIGNLGKPYACNDPGFEGKIKVCVDQFKINGEGLKTLAYRYAYNIANGRFLWRNRVCAGEISIHVFDGTDNAPLEFNAYDYSLKNFDTNSSNEKLQALANIIENGLNGGETNFSFIKIEAYVKLGNRQHVFPSQEMNMKEKGKTLFKLDDCAAVHNVKIGNAIRTIDDWYGNMLLTRDGSKTKSVEIADQDRIPIAVEPYGSVTQRGCAYRANGTDLYTLMLDWINGKKIDENQKTYVVANLIRGGVFSGESEKEAK
jgi:CRISPR-associated protein Csy3